MIIVQIFSHLLPSDLLSVSRVNRAFRAVLLSRNSSFLWNACLRLCGAPPSPSDMSPPAWTHLLFGGAYCYVSNPLFSRIIHTQTQTPQSRVVAQSRSTKYCIRCVVVRASLAGQLSKWPMRCRTSDVLTFLSLRCSTKVPEELRDMVPYDSGLLDYYSLRTLA